MDYNLTMIQVNIAEAKAKLSHYLDLVEGGETVVLCRRNVPIAELRASPVRSAVTRRVGAGRARFGDWQVPPEFDEPLPDWLLDGFEGRSR